MARQAILTQLFLFVLGFVATQQKCADMDPQACQLMAASNPHLCNDMAIAEAACPKFCNLCPIECYHCNTTLRDFHTCNTTKLCAKNEVCMQKVVTSIVDGHHAYQLTCETKDRCDGSDLTLTFGKRAVENRDVSISCCLTDHCNYPGTATEMVTGYQGCRKDVFVVVETGDQLDMDTSTIESFLSTLVASLPIGQDGVLVSVSSVGHHFESLWHLDAYTDITHLTTAIIHMEHRQSAVGNHLLFSQNEAEILALKNAPENRAGAPDVLITITDEEEGDLNAHTLYNTFIGKFDKVIAVGVGRMDSDGRRRRDTHYYGPEFYARERHLLELVPSIAALICPASN